MTVLYDLRKYNELISIDNLKQISKIEYNYLITNSHKDNGIYLYHIARCSQYGIHCKQDDNNAYSTFLKSFEKRLVVIKSITKTIAISIENPPC